MIKNEETAHMDYKKLRDTRNSSNPFARRLGISEMNSRTRLFRAKNHCKKLLEKNFQMCHKSSG